MGNSIKKEIYEAMIKPIKAMVILDNKMKVDLHTTKEEICQELSIRKKDESLDTGKVSNTILSAAISRVYKLKDKSKIQDDFDLYEEIIDLIENKKILVEPIDRYVANYKLKDEETKNKSASKKFAKEKEQDGHISEEDINNISIIVDMEKEQFASAENEKLNKKLGKDTKPKNKENDISVDIQRIQDLIDELGLTNKIAIKEK